MSQQTFANYEDVPVVETKNDCCMACHFYFGYWKASFCIRTSKDVENPLEHVCNKYESMSGWLKA